MPSASLHLWQTTRAATLDQIEAAHASLGGTGRGRRYATQQVNHAYVVLLSGQFQGFCRDLHTECLDYLLLGISPVPLRSTLHSMSVSGRKLDTGNPNPGNIGADFSSFGFRFWDAVYAHDSRNRLRKSRLDLLNDWRNAIAHQDFTGPRVSGGAVQLSQVRQWRRVCNGLALSFDTVMRKRLLAITGSTPW